MHESTELVSPYGMDEYITQDRRLDLIVIQFELDHEVFNSLAIVNEWVEEHRCSLAEMVRFHPELDEKVSRGVNHLCRLVVFHSLNIPRSRATLHSVSDGMGVRLHHHGQGLFSSIKSRRVRVIDVLPAGEQIQEPLNNLPTLALHMILMLVQGMQPKL